MRTRDWIVSAAGAASLGAVIVVSFAAGARAEREPFTAKVELDPGTRLRSPPAASHRPPSKDSATLGSFGATLVADAHGLLVADRSAGALIRADFEGEAVATLALSPELGQLVSDGEGAVFVADRRAHRVVRAGAGRLDERGSVAIREPYGLALSPDGETLYATSVAEHELVAVDADELAVRWRLELPPEPRALAVSADGSQAAVGFLSSSALAIVDLQSRSVRWHSLDPRDHVEIEMDDNGWGGEFSVARIVEARSRFQVPVETGRRYARNVFSLAWIGNHTLAAPHQLATPQMRRVPTRDRSDTYGGGDESIRPMVHRVTMIRDAGSLAAEAGELELDIHQPRALAYDLDHDRLYLGGYGDDRVVALADATQQMPYVDWFAALGPDCGVDGLALGPEGELWVHCEFRRKLLRLEPGDHATTEDDRWLQGPELAASKREPLIEQGAELFRRSNPRTSDDGMLACANCHPEGRSDGLTWRLGASILQAPVLAGRVGGTGPYKWDGQDPTLRASLAHTMERLGGDPSSVDEHEFEALIAYLESLPAPPAKSAEDPEAVARGRALFEAEACNACHSGDKLTDQNQHDLDTTMDQVDTPSLVALGHSAPYYHDGSAVDLRTLLTDRGTIHEMADTSALSAAQIDDLTAYLESL